MGLASEMKNLSEEIVASFKNRIKENEELIIEVQETLDGFQKEHQDMAAALRASLDKGEKSRLKEADILMRNLIKENKERVIEVRETLDGFQKDQQEMAAALRTGLDKDEKNRLKEFVALMKSIKEEISEIFTYTDDLLAKFDKEHLDMAAALRSGLDKDEVNRMKEFVALMKSINEEVLRIFSYTNDLLAKFDKEHQEMSVELRKNLSDGEVERLKEFNVVMKGICNDVKNLKKAVAEDREGASAAWKKMSDILAQLRKTAVTPPKQVVKKVEKKEVKMETPVEAVKKVVKEEVKEVVKKKVLEESPMKKETKIEDSEKTLENKVLNYINAHKKGVSISEMEKPLEENRMRLGYVAKKLLDEGRILKLENAYYPKSKHKSQW
ncbi:MAG: hypothetical protein WC868_13160 [Bacteroidales bacterium]